jgi:RNA polymerase primary sigma factor
MKPVNKIALGDSNASREMKTKFKTKRPGTGSHSNSGKAKGLRARTTSSTKSRPRRSRKAAISKRARPIALPPTPSADRNRIQVPRGPLPPGEVVIPIETLATSRAVTVKVESDDSTVALRESRPTESPGRGVWDEHSSLRLYLRDAVETPLLTAQEEVELARRIQKGDDAAREHMIRANLRLVIKIAREYEDYGLPLLDLVNEGNIGLMRAVERFDPDRGAKLSTYAAWWIKQSIKRALSNQSKSIRLPIHIVQELARMKKAEVRLEADLGRPATDVELAGELEADVDDIRRWREAAAVGATSLDAPIGNDPESNRIADVIADESAVMPWAGVSESSNAELMRELVGSLNPREQVILNQRFALEGGDPRTLEEIGADFGLTRERIRQLEAAALRKLRDRFLAREAMAEV